MKHAVTMQILVSLLVIILSSTSYSTNALTTFGKTNPQTQNQPPPPLTPVGNARDCKMESDCVTIQNTTCIPDRPHDSKMRCLCGDYSAPINGGCNNKGKAVHVPCNDDAECMDGAECVEKNKAGKQCACKENFYEESFKCNGAGAQTIFRFSTIATMTVALLLVKIVGYST